MKNKKTALSFKADYEHREMMRRINENSWFGIISGIILSVVAGYQSLCTVGIVSVLFKIVAAIGLIILVIGSFFPDILNKPVKISKKAGSFLGGLMLKLLLVPVYLLMASVNMVMHKGYSKKFGFDRWENTGREKTSFYDYSELAHKSGRFTTVDIINSVLDFFVANKTFVVIPIVILLLIFGMLIFFASSNAVFSFVYTLF